MEIAEITVVINNKKERATLKYDAAKLIMTFSMANDFKQIYEGYDLYVCLAKIRKDFPDMKFLCKGAKINVSPSRMSSQMSSGIIAYELTMGRSATREDIVNIFTYEENDITNDPQEQVSFYERWLDSLKNKE